MRAAPLAWPVRLALVALAALLAGAFNHGQWLLAQDQAIHDRFAGQWDYPAADELLLVAIDEDSLQRLGQWPWPRALHARLLDRLTDAGARRVALDLLLSEPDRRDPAQDAQLAAAIGRNGRVVLPVLAAPATGERMAEELLPIPVIAASAATLAHSDVAVDADGVTRGAYLHAGLGSPHWPALGLALAEPSQVPRGLSPAITPDAPYQWVRDDYVRVRFAGPAHTIAQVSYADVLDGLVNPAVLRDRRIIVGMTASGIAPRLLTPTSRQTWMSGTEYQANIASMLLQQRTVQQLPSAWQDGLAALMVALCVASLWLTRRSAWTGAATTLLAPPVLSFALLRLGNLWWAPATAMAGCMLVVLATFGWRALQWRRQANRDALTGLSNRARFDAALLQAHDAARRSGRPLAVVMLDVDHFKQHNDVHGHPVGDQVLAAVARLLRAHVRRPRDLAARFGGDEFALLLPDTPAEGAERVAQALLEDVRGLQMQGPHGTVLRIGLSIGIHCRMPGEASTPHAVMIAADAALYRAKANGRDGYALDAG